MGAAFTAPIALSRGVSVTLVSPAFWGLRETASRHKPEGLDFPENIRPLAISCQAPNGIGTT